MKTLILMRHAKAVRDHEAPSDRQRRLTGRGRREAEAAGKALVANRLRPDFALISSAARTRETAAIALADVAPLDARVDETLYLAAPQRIWDAAIAVEADTVIVIGHNPGMAELVAHLIDDCSDRSKYGRELREHLPTSAFAAFDINGSGLAAPGARFAGAWKPERSED